MGPAAVSVAPRRAGARARMEALTLTRLVDLLTLGVVWLMAQRPADDPDLFWHLATGRWITEQGRIPRSDIFSWTKPGRAWVAHEWLTETWLWNLHRLVGYTGLTITFAAIIVAAFAIARSAMRHAGAGVGASNVVVVVAALATLSTWGVRPQMLSMIAMAFEMWLIVHAWQQPTVWARRLWILPPLMLVWANSHGGYMFGIAVIGAFAVGETIDAWRARRSPGSDPRPNSRARSRNARTAWLVTVAMAAATLVNPNGITGFIYPFTYLGDNASTRYVAEWAHPDFTSLTYWPLALLLFGAASGLVRRYRTLPAFAFVMTVPMAALAVQSIRNSGPFAMIAAPWVALGLTGLHPRRRSDNGRGRAGAAPRGVSSQAAGAVHLAVLASAVGAVAVMSIGAVNPDAQRAAHRDEFPVAATAWMQQHPRVRVLNQYDFGGYLILEAPEIPVAMDGRPDMYGDAFMDHYVSIWRTQAGWRPKLDRDGYQRVIGEPGAAIVKALADEADWQVVYRDRLAVVLDRR